MKTKLFSVLSLSVLILVMFMGLGSAVTSTAFAITDVNAPTSVAEDAGSFTFNLTYTGFSEDIDISFNDSTTTIGNISIPTTTGMNGSIDESRIITGTISNFANQGGNTMNVIINATTGSSRDDETTFSVSITDVEEFNFCEYDGGISENPGELDVNIKDITVTKGFGDDEEWLLLDEIEVEVEIENKGDYDVDDISVEWGLYNVDDDEWAIEIDEEDEFNLKDGDEEKLIITFRVDDDDFDLDLDELGNSYTLFVRATGEVDNDTKPKTCASDSESVQIIIESDFIILNDFQFPELVSCGTNVQITADIWNIGDSDQEDVYVEIYNKELGINEEIEVGDIDAFEDKKLVFDFQVPKDAEETWYTLKFTVYDEDGEIYENDYDDKESVFSVSFKVEGNCIVEPQIDVITNLESGGKAGQELVIKATITNTESKLATYELNVAGYDDWATLISVEPSTIILSVGESEDVLITFNVNKDAAGKESSFDIIFSGDASATQHVQGVTIEKSGFGFITGGIISEGNWYLWGIGALNIILIIVIVLVALRVAKKP